MLRTASLVALTSCLCACSGDGGGGTLDKIRARGVVEWGADLQGGEPYVFEDPDHPSVFIGFEVDIMAALARRLGVKQAPQQYNWSNLIPSLERGDFDLTMNGIEATAERADRVLLSEPYYVYGETLAVRDDSKVTSIDQLDGKAVATLNQSVAHDILLGKHVDIRLYEGVQEPYDDLVTGRVDAVLLDDVIANRYGCNMKRVRCLPADVARGTYVIAFRKGDDDLKEAVDDALQAMKDDGELRQILDKWQLWNHRQLEPAPAILEPVSGRARSFDGAQVGLFAEAAWVTLKVSFLAFLLAVPIGLLLALGRVYGHPVVKVLSRVYIELFRGTPVLLQLYVLYYALAPIWELDAMAAAVLGLGLNYAAYEAEVYRAALLSVPRGQGEAAKALGLDGWQTLRHVLVPQAFTTALPAMTNDFVSLLKDSSLISVITVIELTKRMTIASVDLHGWLVPGLACAAFYLVLSVPLSELARQLERRLVRDQRTRTL